MTTAILETLQTIRPVSAEGPHYIYGIVAGADAARLDELDGRPVGGGEQPLTLMAAGRFAAIVSPIDDAEVEPTRRNLLAHTKALEAAMQDVTVLPVRFGSIVPDPTTLLHLLDQHADELAAVHTRIHGRIEIGLKASWERDEVLRDVLDETKDLKAMRDRIQKKPPEKTYYDRIDFGRRLEDAMQARRDQLADTLYGALAPLAIEAKRLEPLDDSMVLNAAFLLERHSEEMLDGALAKLVADIAGGLDMRYVGPVPPYNFVELAIRWGG